MPGDKYNFFFSEITSNSFSPVSSFSSLSAAVSDFSPSSISPAVNSYTKSFVGTLNCFTNTSLFDGL